MKNIILILALLITLTVSAQNPIVVSQTYTPQASAPALTEGRVYYDNIAKVLYVYNGTSWVDLTASVGSVSFTNAASSPGNSTWFGYLAGANDDLTNNFNVGIGNGALSSVTSQIHHTAVGYEAGSSISGDSFDNSIFGYRAGEDLTTGDYNVLLGTYAGDNLVGNQDHNVFIGHDAGSSEATVGDLTTATTSIAIGGNTKMNNDGEINQIVIGYATTGNGSNTVTIGNSSITDNYFNGNIEAEGNFNPDADFGGNVGGNDLSFDQINSGTYYLRDATEKDWYMNHINNNIEFYQETAADSESYTKRYSLNDGGVPGSATDLVTKAYADANIPIVDGDVFAAGWNGDSDAASKDVIYDEVIKKLNSVVTGEPTGFSAISNIGSISQADYDAGTPNSGTFYIVDDATISLTDLTDVNTATVTNKFFLVADGVDFESRAITNADFTVTSELDLDANSIGGTAQSATGDGTTTIDWGNGNMFNFQFGAFNETFTFTAPTNPGTFILKLVQDSVGSRTATWPASVEWPGGTAPTLTTTLTTGTDIITFYYDGTDYFAVSSLDFQ